LITFWSPEDCRGVTSPSQDVAVTEMGAWPSS
jgi:hypothetical protein